MILHTNQPAELIFPADPRDYALTTVEVKGRLIQGMRNGNCFRVSRLMSTDPGAYLDPRFAPGAQFLLDPNDSDFAAL